MSGDHGHGHSHASGDMHRLGPVGTIRHLFSTHSHDHAESIGAATADRDGMRALAVSLAGLGVTAVLQAGVVAVSGSVALLRYRPQPLRRAHRAAAGGRLRLGRRPPDRRYTYGYGRAEDLAGIAIVAMIALSAGRRLAGDRPPVRPRPSPTRGGWRPPG